MLQICFAFAIQIRVNERRSSSVYTKAKLLNNLFSFIAWKLAKLFKKVDILETLIDDNIFIVYLFVLNSDNSRILLQNLCLNIHIIHMKLNDYITMNILARQMYSVN